MSLENFLKKHGLDVTILININEDLYSTYLCIYKSTPVNIKLYTDMSDETNEGQVLELFNELGIIDYNHLLLDIHTDGDEFLILGEYKNIFRIIVYEFEVGYVLHRTDKLTQKLINDIKEQLDKIHNLGFVYGDLRKENILINTEGKAVLIDFGRTYRDPNIISEISAEDYPPMEYMIENEEIDTIEDENKSFERLRR